MGPDRSNGVTLWVARLLVVNLVAYLLKSTLFWAPRFLALFGFSPLALWARRHLEGQILGNGSCGFILAFGGFDMSFMVLAAMGLQRGLPSGLPSPWRRSSRRCLRRRPSSSRRTTAARTPCTARGRRST